MKHLNDFEDFEVLGKSAEKGKSSELYGKYLHFKKIIKKTSLKKLKEHGLLESFSDAQAMSQLFINSLESNNQLFRKNAHADDQLISLWLAKVASRAKSLFVDEEVPSFNKITQEQLKNIARLSQNEKIILELPNYMFNIGVLLIYQQSLPGMKLDGAVFTLASGNPVIGLSFRYPRLDNFWFTFMHELSHICLHFEQLETPILDDFDEKNDQQKLDIEIQANMLAKKSFVDRASWRNCPPKYSNREEDVFAFAETMQIHPAIVAGMLQKESNNYTRYRKIVDKINVREMVFNHG
jgi:HTH-type transcriptional regulator / antitoxin HigA